MEPPRSKEGHTHKKKRIQKRTSKSIPVACPSIILGIILHGQIHPHKTSVRACAEGVGVLVSIRIREVRFDLVFNTRTTHRAPPQR